MCVCVCACDCMRVTIIMRVTVSVCVCACVSRENRQSLRPTSSYQSVYWSYHCDCHFVSSFCMTHFAKGNSILLPQ